MSAASLRRPIGPFACRNVLKPMINKETSGFGAAPRIVALKKETEAGLQALCPGSPFVFVHRLPRGWPNQFPPSGPVFPFFSLFFETPHPFPDLDKLSLFLSIYIQDQKLLDGLAHWCDTPITTPSWPTSDTQWKKKNRFSRASLFSSFFPQGQLYLRGQSLEAYFYLIVFLEVGERIIYYLTWTRIWESFSFIEEYGAIFNFFNEFLFFRLFSRKLADLSFFV